MPGESIVKSYNFDGYPDSELARRITTLERDERRFRRMVNSSKQTDYVKEAAKGSLSGTQEELWQAKAERTRRRKQKR